VVAIAVAVVPVARGDAAPEAPAAPGEALARVDSLVAAGQAVAAVPMALQARERWKDDPVFGWQVEARAGEACLSAGRAPEALPFLEQACRLRPNEGILHHRLGTALVRMPVPDRPGAAAGSGPAAGRAGRPGAGLRRVRGRSYRLRRMSRG
jgi:hypothetical protein